MAELRGPHPQCSSDSDVRQELPNGHNHNTECACDEFYDLIDDREAAREAFNVNNIYSFIQDKKQGAPPQQGGRDAGSDGSKQTTQNEAGNSKDNSMLDDDYLHDIGKILYLSFFKRFEDHDTGDASGTAGSNQEKKTGNQIVEADVDSLNPSIKHKVVDVDKCIAAKAARKDLIGQDDTDIDSLRPSIGHKVVDVDKCIAAKAAGKELIGQDDTDIDSLRPSIGHKVVDVDKCIAAKAAGKDLIGQDDTDIDSLRPSIGQKVVDVDKCIAAKAAGKELIGQDDTDIDSLRPSIGHKVVDVDKCIAAKAAGKELIGQDDTDIDSLRPSIGHKVVDVDKCIAAKTAGKDISDAVIEPNIDCLDPCLCPSIPFKVMTSHELIAEKKQLASQDCLSLKDSLDVMATSQLKQSADDVGSKGPVCRKGLDRIFGRGRAQKRLDNLQVCCDTSNSVTSFPVVCDVLEKPSRPSSFPVLAATTSTPGGKKYLPRKKKMLLETDEALADDHVSCSQSGSGQSVSDGHTGKHQVTWVSHTHQVRQVSDDVIHNTDGSVETEGNKHSNPDEESYCGLENMISGDTTVDSQDLIHIETLGEVLEVGECGRCEPSGETKTFNAAVVNNEVEVSDTNTAQNHNYQMNALPGENTSNFKQSSYLVSDVLMGDDFLLCDVTSGKDNRDSSDTCCELSDPTDEMFQPAATAGHKKTGVFMPVTDPTALPLKLQTLNPDSPNFCLAKEPLVDLTPAVLDYPYDPRPTTELTNPAQNLTTEADSVEEFVDVIEEENKTLCTENVMKNSAQPEYHNGTELKLNNPEVKLDSKACSVEELEYIEVIEEEYETSGTESLMKNLTQSQQHIGIELRPNNSELDIEAGSGEKFVDVIEEENETSDNESLVKSSAKPEHDNCIEPMPNNPELTGDTEAVSDERSEYVEFESFAEVDEALSIRNFSNVSAQPEQHNDPHHVTELTRPEQTQTTETGSVEYFDYVVVIEEENDNFNPESFLNVSFQPDPHKELTLNTPELKLNTETDCVEDSEYIEFEVIDGVNETLDMGSAMTVQSSQVTTASSCTNSDVPMEADVEQTTTANRHAFSATSLLLSLAPKNCSTSTESSELKHTEELKLAPTSGVVKPLFNSTVNDVNINEVDIQTFQQQTRGRKLPPCLVCGNSASGLHFGVNSCEACNEFFRRALKRKRSSSCPNDGACDVTGTKRGACGACRFQKCLKAGMSRERIKTGRYSHTKVELDALEAKQLDDGATSSQHAQNLELMIENLSSVFSNFDHSGVLSAPDVLPRESSGLPKIENFIRDYIRLLNHIPGYVTLCADDRMTLAKKSWMEFWILSKLKADRVSYKFHEFHEELGQEFTSTVNPLLNTIRELDLSTNALMLMKLVTLTSSDCISLINKPEVEQLHASFVQCLLHELRKQPSCMTSSSQSVTTFSPEQRKLFTVVMTTLKELRTLARNYCKVYDPKNILKLFKSN
ncbi:uncharacterized protein LOC131953667 [Physella acuta]|uniref:uncharacterized protein LOC131953667 n=1 Tax=Physella acuta TaxID=109671 RepID=UPI0027DDEA7D|nr:uncharacterized protein LOC131953667 [Physella acuta]